MADLSYTETPLRKYLNARSEQRGACRIWLLSTDKNGYGYATWRGVVRRAHRLSLEEKVGPLPPGKCACHSCDTPACIEPDHLWAGTNEENTADRDSKGRQSKGAEHAVTFNANPKWLQALPRGAGHVNSKLTETQVISIRADARSQRVVAEDYGVSQRLISMIKRRLAWAHI